MRFKEVEIMKKWNLWRSKIANGDKSSAPRDWHEDVEDALTCSTQVICGCGDHIELLGKRDYKFVNGEYYCTDCMLKKD